MDRIEKRIAISRYNAILGRSLLNNQNTHFANINNAKDIWWYDIPTRKISKGIRDTIIYLLMYDYRNDQLYLLAVPTEYFRENMHHLVVREDTGTISLELSVYGSNRFQDKRSGGAGVQFAQFLQ